MRKTKNNRERIQKLYEISIDKKIRKKNKERIMN